ncbi:MAG: hypothetical protein ACXWP4_25050 [Polyangiales bacterium]
MSRNPSVEMAVRIYSREARDAQTAEETVGAVIRCCETLERAISEVVGEMGFRAMLTRCLRRTKKAYPSLPVLGSGDRSTFYEPLWICLRQQEPALIAEICVALLAGFFDLLSTLIGDELTLRIFRDAWPDAFSSSPAEKP